MKVAGWSRRIVAVVVAAVAMLAVGTPALAYPPVDIVHTEQVAVGPYRVTVGFSTWPIRAMRSLDFTFLPDGGIAGKSGYLSILGPGTDDGPHRHSRLVRHPRKRDAWGLDVLALDKAGDYSFGFAIDGPQGHGEGTLAPVAVLSQPGPPLAVSWTVGSLPAVALIVIIAIAWRRTRPGRQPCSDSGRGKPGGPAPSVTLSSRRASQLQEASVVIAVADACTEPPTALL